MSPIPETLVIWRAEVGRALRSGRVVALLVLYSLFSALVLLVVGGLVRGVRAQVSGRAGDEEAARQMAQQLQQTVVGALVGTDQAVLAALEQVPVVVVVLFKLSLLFLPAYVALMGFDQVSGELATRSVRYLTVRARRASVLGGKFLSQATVLLGVVLLVDVAVFAYALATEPDFPAGVAALTLLRVWAASAVFSLAYVALTTLCSTLAGAPGLSLVANFAALFGFWLVNLAGSAAHLSAEVGGEPASPLARLRFLSPSHYAGGLLDPRAGPFLSSALAFLLFAAGFLLLAHLALRVKDV